LFTPHRGGGENCSTGDWTVAIIALWALRQLEGMFRTSLIQLVATMESAPHIQPEGLAIATAQGKALGMNALQPAA